MGECRARREEQRQALRELHRVLREILGVVVQVGLGVLRVPDGQDRGVAVNERVVLCSTTKATVEQLPSTPEVASLLPCSSGGTPSSSSSSSLLSSSPLSSRVARSASVCCVCCACCGGGKPQCKFTTAALGSRQQRAKHRPAGLRWLQPDPRRVAGAQTGLLVGRKRARGGTCGPWPVTPSTGTPAQGPASAAAVVGPGHRARGSRASAWENAGGWEEEN